MEQRTVGDSGLRVSRLGLATHTWGGRTDADTAAAQLAAFTEAGGTLVDTAPHYHHGAAQQILGKALGHLTARDEVVLSGCAGIHPGRPHHEPLHRQPARTDTSRRMLLRQLDTTLTELGVDHLDVWHIAAWDPDTPLAEIAATLEWAQHSGRVRYAGVRGHNAWQLASLAGLTPLIAAQTPYSLLTRNPETDLLPAAAHHGLGLFATAPLAGGILTGKYCDGVPADSRGADETTAHDIRTRLDDGATRVVDAVITAADGLGTSPLSVALAWVRDRPCVASTIVAARDMGQLTGVLAAETLELPGAIIAALDDVSCTT